MSEQKIVADMKEGEGKGKGEAREGRREEGAEKKRNAYKMRSHR